MELIPFNLISSTEYAEWLGKADMMISRGYVSGELEVVAERMYNAHMCTLIEQEDVKRLNPDGSADL